MGMLLLVSRPDEVRKLSWPERAVSYQLAMHRIW